jgi:hypothetical protein
MLEKITRPDVRAAIQAWQDGDVRKWIAHFSVDPKLYDDGSLRNFQSFSADMGRERFTSIDRVDNDGLDVYGHFHSETWGDFKTYFKFHVGSDGKFNRLDIGHADY